MSAEGSNVGQSFDGTSTSLSEYLQAFLKAEGLSYREAAKLAKLPPATINALVVRQGGYVRQTTRDGLVRLGLDADVLEVLAAQQAGFTVGTLITADEVKLLRWYRKLDEAKRKRLRNRIRREASES